MYIYPVFQQVYSVDNPSVEYTLHGHCSPITCLFVDRFQSGTGGSGSQNGLLCVWDLLTGVCMYNIEAHDGAITSLACAPSYVISLGIDERVCVWERFQGNLLSAINISNAYSNLLMLTPSLLVTCKLGKMFFKLKCCEISFETATSRKPYGLGCEDE